MNHLATTVSESELKSLFSQFGVISDGRVHIRVGNDEKYAYINYCSPADAQKAASAMNRKDIHGNKISVKIHGDSTKEVYTIKVSNIAKHTSEEAIAGLFSLSGKLNVHNVNLIECGEGHPFNYAYVKYRTLEDARQAETQMDGRRVSDSNIKVRIHTDANSPQPHMTHLQATVPLLQSPHVAQPVPTYRSHQPYVYTHQSQAAMAHDQPVPTYRSHQPYVYTHQSQAAMAHDQPVPTYRSHQPYVYTHQSQAAMAHDQPVPTYRSHQPYVYTHQSQAAMAHDQPVPTYRSHQPYVYTHQFQATNPSFQSQGPIHHQRPVSISPRAIHPHPSTHRPYVSQPQMFRPQAGLQPMASFGKQVAGTKPQSNAVKVSILGDLLSDDLEGAFSKFGLILGHPIIRTGSPKYAYINFQSPSEALAACQLHGHQIKGVRIHVRLSGKQAGPNTVSNHDCKAVPCDPLVVKLLMSKYQDQLKKITESQQVSIKPMKRSNGVNLWGDSTKLNAAEVCLQLILEKIQGDIDGELFTLPCLYAPMFRNYELITQIGKIEDKHGVEFTAVDHTPQAGVTPLAMFGTIISGHFNSTTDTPQVSCVSPFLEAAMSTPSDSSVWLWEEDDHSYTPYQPDLCSTLSKQFSTSPKGSFQCQITTNTCTSLYTIDFTSMTRTNIRTGTQRSIKYQAGTPRWLYRDDRKQFVPYTPQDSTEIETMFKSSKVKNLVINGKTYTFDFTSMRQINFESRYERPIQRQLESDATSISSYNLRLQVRGMKPNLQEAIEKLKEELVGGVVTSEQMLPSNSDATLYGSLLETTGKHFVDAKITERKIVLRGMQGYIERVMFLVREQILAYEQRIVSQRSASARIMETPDCWEAQTEKIELKLVKTGCSEWKRIQSCMLKTLPSAQIVKLERIQNQWLLEKYTFSKQRMTEKNKGDVNEKELFHGTKKTPPEKIFKSEHGFDFRFSSQGMWGEGTYFAVNAQYSDRYAYSVGDNKRMILAKVLTGETCRCQPDGNLKKPPVKPSQPRPDSSSGEVFEDERYDSVSGNTSGSDIFVIYDHEKAYPAYLITYKTAATARLY